MTKNQHIAMAFLTLLLITILGGGIYVMREEMRADSVCIVVE